MESLHQQFPLRKVITSAHSKSPDSSGFNSILQKYYEVICEITVSKTVGGIFLIFWLSSFINNFMVKNNSSEAKNQRKLNISRSIYFLKNSTYRFVGLICTNKLKELFFQKKPFFEELGSFFTTAKSLIWKSFFP